MIPCILSSGIFLPLGSLAILSTLSSPEPGALVYDEPIFPAYRSWAQAQAINSAFLSVNSIHLFFLHRIITPDCSLWLLLFLYIWSWPQGGNNCSPSSHIKPAPRILQMLMVACVSNVFILSPLLIYILGYVHFTHCQDAYWLTSLFPWLSWDKVLLWFPNMISNVTLHSPSVEGPNGLASWPGLCNIIL